MEIIKNYSYTIKNGNVKLLKVTNLQSPTEYLITYTITLTVLECKVNEISSKPFYIKEYQQKYKLKKVKQISYLFNSIDYHIEKMYKFK